MIDWLFECREKLRQDDQTVVHHAVCLMDQYYSNLTSDKPSKDLQLTAVTAFFIQNKNLEVDPIDLHLCYKTLCYNKYTR